MTDGFVRRAWLGIAGGPRPLPPTVRERIGAQRAVEVLEVLDGSPADRTGIRPEDLIVSVGGEPIADVADLQRLKLRSRSSTMAFVDLGDQFPKEGVRFSV